VNILLLQALVQDIEDLARMGKNLEICPYYGARQSISSSQIVTLPYNLMLQKSARESLGINLKNNIVIFGMKAMKADCGRKVLTCSLKTKRITSWIR
jgi:chromosome transmission fidelity protein 1